jgi:hypothetical protein
MQGGDKHCRSVVGYSKNMARLCRQCNIAGDESGDPLVKCKKMSMVKIRQYVLAGEAATLRLISQNNVYSAWFDCDFGGCELGVFSAAMPVEALHAVEGGICKDAAAILFDGDLKDANYPDFKTKWLNQLRADLKGNLDPDLDNVEDLTQVEADNDLFPKTVAAQPVLNPAKQKLGVSIAVHSDSGDSSQGNQVGRYCITLIVYVFH